MDGDSVDNLSARQKVSQWIEKLSRHNLESTMDRICDKIYPEKKLKGLDR